MIASDLIVAPATALGRGAIAIVRLSGRGALELALSVTRRRTLDNRRATLTLLYDSDSQPIDQAIVIYFAAPHSYTGEDIAEFQVHGGAAVASQLIDTLITRGARAARAGEFTARAVANGKIDLTQAEAILALTNAKNSKAASLLTRHLNGELGIFAQEIRARLLRLLAYCETAIDYAEELDSTVQTQMFTQLDALKTTLDKTLASSARHKGIISGFEAVIIGKPNSGKSSLLNALLGRERAIVSSTAGTTRDLISEELLIGSHIVKFTDTAGMRHSDDTIEQIGIDFAVRQSEKADLIIALFDGSAAADESDHAVKELLAHTRANVLRVINKSDLPQLIDIDFFDGAETVAVSAKNDISPLFNALEKLLISDTGGEETLLISARQIELVSTAKNALITSEIHLKSGALELFSLHINEALSAFGALTHRAEYGELLDTMFGEFCLGK